MKTNSQRFTNRKAMSFGIFTAITSILDWYLNAPIRNPPLTEQERLIYECFLERPQRVMAPPEMSPAGIGYLLAVVAGVIFLGFMTYRSVESIRADCHASTSLFLNLVRVIALLAGVCAAGLVCYVDFKLPTVMRFYFVASFGITVYLWSERIFRLPCLLLRHPR